LQQAGPHCRLLRALPNPSTRRPRANNPRNQSDTWSARAVDCVAFFCVTRGPL
jgi:hypothetical protein